MQKLSRVLVLLALAAVSLPSVAHAGGFELIPIGTRALGRGGAFSARADDGMAMFYNPAMLADSDDFVQLQLSAGLAFWDACVDRSGTYALDALAQPTVFPSDAWLNQEMPMVCNSGPPQIIPHVTASFRLLPELSLAVGVWAPGGVGAARFGDADGTIRMPDGTRAPSPTRYAMFDRNLLLFAPSVGVGWRPVEWLRVGVTLQWGIVISDFTNFTQTGLGGVGEDPSHDIRTRLQTVDAFVPAGIFSVHVVPHRNVDLMFASRISDSVGGATPSEGTLDLTTGAFGDSVTDGSSVPTTTRVTGTTLSAGQPWEFTLGVRYADRIRPRAYEHGPLGDVLTQVDDPMFGENFDLELNVTYLYLSQVNDFVVRNPDGMPVSVQRVGEAAMPVRNAPTLLPLPHGWSDALRIRFGGDVNVVPGTFAVRAGLSYEQPLDYGFVRWAQNDFMQGWNLGLFLGATLRLDRFDISLAYGHVFAETITVTNGELRQVSALGDENAPGCVDAAYADGAPTSDTGCYPSLTDGAGALQNTGVAGTVNSGSYFQELNVVQLGLAYHFD
jgi:long-chain fatty acid transport protein